MEGELLALFFTSGGPATIPRQISMLFIAGIICSVLVVPFHNNNGCILRTDCPLCKFAIDFSSCDKTDPETLVRARIYNRTLYSGGPELHFWNISG